MEAPDPVVAPVRHVEVTVGPEGDAARFVERSAARAGAERGGDEERDLVRLRVDPVDLVGPRSEGHRKEEPAVRPKGERLRVAEEIDALGGNDASELPRGAVAQDAAARPLLRNEDVAPRGLRHAHRPPHAAAGEVSHRRQAARQIRLEALHAVVVRVGDENLLAPQAAEALDPVKRQEVGVVPAGRLSAAHRERGSRDHREVVAIDGEVQVLKRLVPDVGRVEEDLLEAPGQEIGRGEDRGGVPHQFRLRRTPLVLAGKTGLVRA